MLCGACPVPALNDKTERHRPGGLDSVEYATPEWVAWFNHRRLLEPIGYVPPAEFEEGYYVQAASERRMTQTNGSPLKPERSRSLDVRQLAISRKPGWKRRGASGLTRSA